MKSIKNLKAIFHGTKDYLYDLKADCHYSTLVRGTKMSGDSLLSSLVERTHTIEKGLTMPQKRFNFGHKKLIEIISDIEFCIEHFDTNDDRLGCVIAILLEYKRWHAENNQVITNESVDKGISRLASQFGSIKPLGQYYSVHIEDFFKESKSDFMLFSNSRHSCRNLSGEVDKDTLLQAISLATNAPSTCNRQSVRVHVLDKNSSIMDIQKGNRGFGQLVKTSLLITSRLTHWPGGRLRHAPYVDGGIFVMNLLYSLHYYGIAACTLNMYLDEVGMKRIQKELSIPVDEVPVALIAVGMPPKVFDVARSERRPVDKIVTYHNL